MTNYESNSNRWFRIVNCNNFKRLKLKINIPKIVETIILNYDRVYIYLSLVYHHFQSTESPSLEP